MTLDENSSPVRASPSALDRAVAALQALRPKQWVKNVLLFAALIFSMNFTEPGMWLRAFAAFAAFSLVSSSGYLVNDARDVEADRRHPTKRNRPIASGRLSLPMAYALVAAVWLFGIVIAWRIGPGFLLMTLLYFATTLSYSLYFKHVVILDVMFLASGFLWRAAAGAVAIGVTISPWLLTCTAFGALYLGFNKRRGELAMMRERADVTRKILREYSRDLVVEMQAVTASGTVISYALYTVLGSPSPWLLLTLPHVLYGVFRYMYLVTMKGEGGAPDDTLLRDRPLLATCLLYAVTVVAILLLAPLRSQAG